MLGDIAIHSPAADQKWRMLRSTTTFAIENVLEWKQSHWAKSTRWQAVPVLAPERFDIGLHFYLQAGLAGAIGRCSSSLARARALRQLQKAAHALAIPAPPDNLARAFGEIYRALNYLAGEIESGKGIDLEARTNGDTEITLSRMISRQMGVRATRFPWIWVHGENSPEFFEKLLVRPFPFAVLSPRTADALAARFAFILHWEKWRPYVTEEELSGIDYRPAMIESVRKQFPSLLGGAVSFTRPIFEKWFQSLLRTLEYSSGEELYWDRGGDWWSTIVEANEKIFNWLANSVGPTQTFPNSKKVPGAPVPADSVASPRLENSEAIFD